MKKILFTLTFAATILVGGVAHAANNEYHINVLPIADERYDLGSTTPNLEWRNLFVKNVFVSGTCTGCGGGSGGAWPFTTGLSNFGVAVQATTTPEWFQNGMFASSTSQFVSASSTGVSTSNFWITGQSAGCAQFDSSAKLTSTGTNCGTGGSGAWPFTTTDTNYGVAVQSTTTPEWFKIPASGLFSLMASGTAAFVNASTTNVSASGVIYGAAGAVGAPAVTVSDGGGLYRIGTNSLGLTNGVAGLTWDGTMFAPNTTNARNLGGASNIWNKAWINAASTTDITTSNSLHLSQLTGYAPLVVDQNKKVTTQATSTFYSGTAGQVLAFLNNQWIGAATTTAGTGLSYSGGAFNVNTSQNIATLSNLTTNGFVRTSGGGGTLGVQTDPCTFAMGCTGATSFGANRIPYINSGNTAFTSSASLYFDGTYAAIGTSTPKLGVLTVGSSTAPDLMLTSNNAADPLWAFNILSGKLFLATSTALATSSISAFAIDNTTGAITSNAGATSTFSAGLQATYLNVTGTTATSTFGNGINLATGCFAIAGTCVGGSSGSFSVAGRSLTASGSTIDADSELFTFGIAPILAATTSAGIATTTGDLWSVRVPIASTITNFSCYAEDSGTSTITAIVTSTPDNTTNDTNLLYTTGVQCGSGHTVSTSTFSSTAIAANSWIRFYVKDAAPTGSRPRVIHPNFTLTKDD